MRSQVVLVSCLAIVNLKFGTGDKSEEAHRDIGHDDCVFPFLYGGVHYDGCITTSYTRPWCSTTRLYAGGWRDCEDISDKNTSRNFDHGDCIYPFYYEYDWYYGCQSLEGESESDFWCPYVERPNTKNDWVQCEIPGINECMTHGVCGVGGKCVDTAESYVCVCTSGFTGGGVETKCEEVTEEEPPDFDIQARMLSDAVGIQADDADLEPVMSHESCVFPFSFGGGVFDGCTTLGFHQPWCSTTDVYMGGWRICKSMSSLKAARNYNHNECVYPYKYNHDWYYGCIIRKDINVVDFWCSKTEVPQNETDWVKCSMEDTNEIILIDENGNVILL